MSIFKEWLKNRRGLREGLADAGDPAARFDSPGAGEDFADDHEKVQAELFKAVLTKYPEETMDFLNSIAQRGDEEIAALLKKAEKGSGPGIPGEPEHPNKDRDEFVPPSSDSGHNPEFGGSQ